VQEHSGSGSKTVTVRSSTPCPKLALILQGLLETMSRAIRTADKCAQGAWAGGVAKTMQTGQPQMSTHGDHGGLAAPLLGQQAQVCELLLHALRLRALLVDLQWSLDAAYHL